MGCYMSQPDNRVFVTEGKGKDFIYATASCQGWRREQEDAEDCIPNFDDDASLFILCDGHGGAEVAKYTVEHFPKFFKNHQLYKEGKYEEALEKAFIEFDALLRTNEVNEELCRIAFQVDDDQEGKETDKDVKIKDLSNNEDGGPSSSMAPGPSSSTSNNGSNQSHDFVEDVDSETLRREAQLPLQTILGKHFSGAPQVKYDDKEDNSSEQNKFDENGEAACTSSASGDKEPVASSSKSMDDSEPQQGPSNASTEVSIKEKFIKKVIQRYFPPEDDSSDDSEYDLSKDGGVEGDDEDDESGAVGEGSGSTLSAKKLRRRKLKRRDYEPPSPSSSDDDDDDDDDEDDDDDDDEEDDDEDDDDDDEEESDDEDDDDDDDENLNEDGDDDQWEDMDEEEDEKASRAHKPGTDSGCTVVVALLKNDKLYVASAGDSRCIIIKRDGVCVPMCFDHKPEDNRERRRIVKAGGRVTEGRVNGGLNLSRAFGDFTYKSPDLEAKDQMITPCPDVKVIDFDQVEYIFLACDGIWNSKNNTQTAKFICKNAKTLGDDLISICLELFRACIAPKTDGDGTGCDNMTCIIAKFADQSKQATSDNSDLKTELKKNSEEVVDPSTASVTADATSSSSPAANDAASNDTTISTSATTKKRSTNDEESNDMSKTKRRCLRL